MDSNERRTRKKLEKSIYEFVYIYIMMKRGKIKMFNEKKHKTRKAESRGMQNSTVECDVYACDHPLTDGSNRASYMYVDMKKLVHLVK